MDRVEQRHEALQAVGQRARRDWQSLVGVPRRDPAQRAPARTVLEQEPRPEAGSIERSGEQTRRWRRRHLQGRGHALATPAPARPLDFADVGLDRDLDQRRHTLAVGDIGLAATGTGARILRRVARFFLLLELGPRGAAVAGRAALLAALASRARLLLPLALAPEGAAFDNTARLDRSLSSWATSVSTREASAVLSARNSRASARNPLRLGTQPGVALAQRFDGLLCPLGGLVQPGEPPAQRPDDGLLLVFPPPHAIRTLPGNLLVQPVEFVAMPGFEPLPVFERLPESTSEDRRSRC